jgi:membrane protease subunit HflC
MKSTSTLFVGLLVIVLLIGYMVTYQVAFNEVAVVTTFGKAGAGAVKRGDAAEGGFIGNLHWRWPSPIQKVYKYDARIRVLEDRLEELQTLDKQSVIIQAYVAWRISDPLAFYQSMSAREAAAVEKAIERLRAGLRDAKSEIGRFTFDQLTNSDPGQLRIGDLEDAIQAKLQASIDREEPSWGITIEDVGIQRIELPDKVTEKVFERMKATRQRLAQSARSEGEARASDIKSKAESARQRIESFAERRAQEIRAEGAAAAAQYYSVFQQNEDFAIFLRKLEALRQTLAHNTTFLIDTRVMPFDMFAKPAAATDGN